MNRIATLICAALGSVCLFVTVLAQGELMFGNPANFCRNGAFPGGGDYEGARPVFKLAQLTGAANSQIHFINDDDGSRTSGDCPRADNAGCVAKGYLIPGDQVIVSKSYRDYACSWYQRPGRTETVGWLPMQNLKFLELKTPAQGEWLGTWRNGDDTLTLSRGASPSEIQVSGEAYWPGRNLAPFHQGSLEGAARPNGNTLTLGDKDNCRAWITLVADRLIASDDHNCGGMNVNFDGLYRKTSRR